MMAEELFWKFIIIRSSYSLKLIVILYYPLTKDYFTNWNSFLDAFSNTSTLLRLTPDLMELTGDVYKRVVVSSIIYFLI